MNNGRLSSLQKRILSSVAIIVVIGVAARLFGARGMLVVGLVVCAGGVIEFSQLTLKPLNQSRWLNGLYIVTAISLLIAAGMTPPANWFCLFLAIVPVLLSFALWAKREAVDQFSVQPFAGLAALGLIYTSIIPGMTLHLLLIPHGLKWFALLLVVVFTGDVAAYSGGSIFGGPKLMPAVSPNKTISGSISGLVGSALVGIIFVQVFKMPTSLFVAAGLSLVIGVVAQSGDLFESLLKRARDVKDSGYFLPGHGGVLDRLDGVYFAAPIILCAAHWFS